MRELAGILALFAGFWLAAAEAGFRTPESLVRNVYAYYGAGAPELSKGLPRDTATARLFFDPSLRKVWSAPRAEPYDFLVQSPSWKLGPVAVAILRKQYDKTYVAAIFDNHGRRVMLNFILDAKLHLLQGADVEGSASLLRRAPCYQTARSRRQLWNLLCQLAGRINRLDQ